MDLETIQSMWVKDSQIDQDNLHDEASKIPSLHAKYFEMYNNIKLLRERAYTQESKVKLDRHSYYTGKADPEVYEKDPFPYKVREKEALQRYMGADERVQSITLKIKYYDVMLKFLEEIIRVVSNRTYQIKNAIEWNKFQSGFG